MLHLPLWSLPVIATVITWLVLIFGVGAGRSRGDYDLGPSLRAALLLFTGVVLTLAYFLAWALVRS